jgi:hypothetical protein
MTARLEAAARTLLDGDVLSHDRPCSPRGITGRPFPWPAT